MSGLRGFRVNNLRRMDGWMPEGEEEREDSDVERPVFILVSQIVRDAVGCLFAQCPYLYMYVAFILPVIAHDRINS